MAENNDKEAMMAEYAALIEGGITNPSTPVQNTAKAKEEVKQPSLKMSLKEQAEEKIRALKETSALQEHAMREEELKGMSNMQLIKMQDLPTQGMFYPVGTTMWIKPASMEVIRHWSAINDLDYNEIDDGLNSIIESCFSMYYPKGAIDPVTKAPMFASFRDLKEVDRFYVILAIHDLTFTKDLSPIKISINEVKDIEVEKNSIEFVKFSDKMLNYYDEQYRCFRFPCKAKSVPNQKLDIYLPSIGVSHWLKNYAQTKSQRQEEFDKDFIGWAPLLIDDYKHLNNDYYAKLINATLEFGPYEWALLAKVKKAIEQSINPQLIYTDEGGVQKTTSLNFRGGIKSILSTPLDLDI